MCLLVFTISRPYGFTSRRCENMTKYGLPEERRISSKDTSLTRSCLPIYFNFYFHLPTCMHKVWLACLATCLLSHFLINYWLTIFHTSVLRSLLACSLAYSLTFLPACLLAILHEFVLTSFALKSCRKPQSEIINHPPGVKWHAIFLNLANLVDPYIMKANFTVQNGSDFWDPTSLIVHR